MTVRQIVAEARQLPAEQWAQLVDTLLSEAAEPDPKVDEAWRMEVRRRIADIESGKVQGVPLEQSLAKARRILKRGR
jgi:putative addiction module component (TIGR02574 family)